MVVKKDGPKGHKRQTMGRIHPQHCPPVLSATPCLYPAASEHVKFSKGHHKIFQPLFRGYCLLSLGTRTASCSWAAAQPLGHRMGPGPATSKSVPWCRWLIDDYLNDKVLLDFGFLKAGPICQKLARKKPALPGWLQPFLGKKLLFELPNSVSHAGTQAQVLASGEAYFEREFTPGVGCWLRGLHTLLLTPLHNQVDRRGKAINRQLVPVPQFIVALCKGACRRMKKPAEGMRGLG